PPTAYDNGTGQIFLPAGRLLNRVDVVDGATKALVTSVAVGTTPYGMAYDRALGEIFVENQGSDNVSVINDTTDQVVASVRVGFLPVGIAYDRGKGEVFVTNCASNNLS